jgi:hypothetical protein
MYCVGLTPKIAPDPVFKATQEISSNSTKIASAESTVRSCEEELGKLSELNKSGVVSSWWRNPVSDRSRYLLRKLRDAEKTVEKLEAANADLKKLLAKSV